MEFGTTGMIHCLLRLLALVIICHRQCITAIDDVHQVLPVLLLDQLYINGGLPLVM